MGMKDALDRPAREKEWAATEARLKLNEEDKATWATLTHTMRPHVYQNKILIAWTIKNGIVSIRHIFNVTAVDANFQQGLWVRLHDRVSKTDIILNHTPRRLVEGTALFAWVPYFNEMRYVSEDFDDLTKPRSMRLALCFKMPENPNSSVLHTGKVYLSELHTFRAQFPEYAKTFF